MTYPDNSTMPVVEKRPLKGHLQIDPWLIAVLACFTLLALTSWGKVEYPIIDVGREVEIPARILAGQLLYRDVETYYGPLAYYANALALLLFGQHLEVFFALGQGLALASTLLFYRLAKKLTDGRWATLCTVCMLIYCALSPGLFHFVVPYSYGSVYAILLCLLAITALDSYTCTGRVRWLFAAAIACGLALVAKQEYGVAVLGAVLVGTNLYSGQNLQTRVGRSLLVLVVALGCAIVPLALIAQQISWETLYLSLFPLPKVDVIKRSSLFQVSPRVTFRAWRVSFGIFFASSLVVWVSLIAAQQISKLKAIAGSDRFRVLVEVLVSAALSGVSLILLYVGINPLYPVLKLNPLGDLSWSLPVLAGWFALRRPQLPRYKHAPLMWTLLVFSLLLNARWLFYINFYGLYAVPVILLFFTLLYHSTQRIKVAVWRFLLVCLLIAGSVQLGKFAKYRYAVNSSYGTFYTTNASLGSGLNQAINAINASSATSVLVLPEGNILNFLTATHSPSREVTFLPLTLPTSKDEQGFVARMQANPPELIVYVGRSFVEWGYKTYADFNPIVDNWITQQHRLVNVFPNDEGAIRIYAPKQ